MNTEKAFEFGRQAGLDSIEQLVSFESDYADHFHSALCDIVAILLNCVYSHAPSNEAAEKLINTAKNWAKEGSGIEIDP